MKYNKYITGLFTKGGPTMRALITLIIATVFLASCSKTYESATTYPYDEVYDTYGESRVAYTNSKPQGNSDAREGAETYSEGDYYSPEYSTDEFESEDYYDYEYSSRIRRFHQPNPGFGYYDPYYTDYYRYGYSPFSFGSSIYSGWGCSYPYYAMPRFTFSMSFGYGYNPYYRPWHSPWYNPWYYDAWYNPWYGYYPPGFGYGPYYNYGSYWNGYYHGFYDGYYANTYYPSSGYYYGPRGTIGGSSDGSGGNSRSLTGLAGGSGKSEQTVTGNGALVSSKRIEGGGAKKISSSSATKALKPGTSSKTAGGAVAGTQTDRMQKPASERSVSAPKQASRTTVYQKPQSDAGRSKLKKPGNTGAKSPKVYTLPNAKYKKPKAYTGPKIRTTPSSREYTSPSAKSSRNFGKRTYTTVPERKVYTGGEKSQRNNRYFNMPATNNSRSYSPSSSRSVNTRSYSTPSRSYNSGSSGNRSSSVNRSSGSSSRSVGSRSGGSRGGRR